VSAFLPTGQEILADIQARLKDAKAERERVRVQVALLESMERHILDQEHIRRCVAEGKDPLRPPRKS
jgi:hypothetical protein